MKKILATLIVALVAVAARADYTNDAITTYIPAYVFVSNVVADAGDTGLSLGVNYVCIPLSNLVYATEAQMQAEGATSSYRALVFAFCKSQYDTITALDSTNRPTHLVAGEGAKISGSGYLQYSHTFTTDVTIDSLALPDED